MEYTTPAAVAWGGDTPARNNALRRVGHWLLLGTAVLASGCGQLDARRHISAHEPVTTMNRPVVRPVRSISSFSDSLSCMDHMLRAAELPTTLISSKQFPDLGGRPRKVHIYDSIRLKSRILNEKLKPFELLNK